MSLRIQDICLHTSRQCQAELLSWSLRNQGRTVRLGLVQNSIIPKLSLSRLLSKLSTASREPLPKPSLYIMRGSLSINRFNSTFVPIESSIIPSTLDNRLYELIQKSPKTRDSLVELKDLSLEAALSQHNTLDKYRSACLEIFFSYKKYDWIDELIEKLEGNLDIEDHSIVISKLAMLKKWEQIKEDYKDWSTEDLLTVLNLSMNALFKAGRKRTALMIWITLVSIKFPNIEIGSSPERRVFSESLNSIVDAFKPDVNEFLFVFDFIQNDLAKQNFLYLLGQKYEAKGFFEQSLKIWEFTPNHLKTMQYYDLIFKKLYYTGVPLSALEHAKKYPHLQSEKTKSMIANLITSLEFCKPEFFPIILGFIEEKRFFNYQITRIFRKFLQYKKYDNFDELVKAYKNTGIEPTVDILNLYMKRALACSSYKEILQYLGQIQDIKSKPNPETFMILMKQFARMGDSKSAVSLLELLAERNEVLTIEHMNLVLEACVRSQDFEALKKIDSYMKTLEIEPNLKFIQNLMHLHFTIGQYDKVSKIFLKLSNQKPTIMMYSLLIKSLLITRKFLPAHAAFKVLTEKKPSYIERSTYYLTLIQYYAMQGLFTEALNVFQRMKGNGIPRTAGHYHTLMTSYNRRGRYEDSLVVFQLMNDEKIKVEAMNYRDLLVSMVQLRIISKDNFNDPIAVVDRIIEESQKGKLFIEGTLPFLVIKPVVQALIKFYKPDDAYRIMTNFRVVNPDFEVNQKINYMKQELMLFSTIDKWGSYAVTHENFQNKIKSLLTVDGKAPPNLKKVYNGIIRSIYKFYYLKGDSEQFSKLFRDLIFVHGFTFTSSNINWIIRRLIMNKKTFHDSLYIVEKKLIGGYIAKKAVKYERADKRRAGEKHSRYVSKGRFLKPHLALGHIHRLVVEKQIYNHIMGGKGINEHQRNATIKELKEKYPKTMRHLKSVYMRITRRTAYFSSVKEKFPKRNTRRMVQLINKTKENSKNGKIVKEVVN